MRCYYFMVLVVCGVVCGCVGLKKDECYQATNRTDFRIFRKSCFWVSPPADKRTWNGAQYVCSDFGGNLATVTSKETLEFLNENWNIERNTYWIGLYLNATDVIIEDYQEGRTQANWKWLDGTMYDYQNSIEWENYEPGTKETIVGLQYSKMAAFQPAQNTFHFICETKLKGSKTQSSQETTSTKMSKPSDGTQTGDCGEWVYNEATRLCYLPALTSNLDWDAAKDQCEQMNAHLATPSTPEQHQAVVELLSKKELSAQDVWIGLWHEYGASGSNPKQGWTWLDNASYDFMAWAEGEPQAPEKYVRIKDGLWLGKGAGTFNHILCQKGPIEAQIPQTPQSPQTPTQQPSRASDTVTSSTQKSPNVVATNTGQKDTLGGNKMSQRSTTDILGPALGTGLGVLLVALLVAVVFIKRRRNNSVISHLKICPFSQKPDEHYCDINDNDLDPTEKPSAAVYYNDIASHGHPVSRENLHNESALPGAGSWPSGHENYNDTDNYEQPIRTNVPKASPLSPTYTHLQ